MTETNPFRLRRFVRDLATLLSETADEAAILAAGEGLLRDLVAKDDWLPDAFARPAAGHAQYLLHCDSLERFSIVSFVWSPGRGSPVHNHTVWGLIGVLRGAEISQPFALTPGGLAPGAPILLQPGDVERVSARVGDLHMVINAIADGPSVSIHVYGGNIGAVERSIFNAAGQPRRFVSGYTNTVTPNLWDGILSPE